MGGSVAVVLLGRMPLIGQEDNQARLLVLTVGWGISALLLSPLWRSHPPEGLALGAGFLAMAVNLIAAGGIGFPPVALAFWGLGAIGQDLRDDRPAGRLRTLGGRWLAFGLGLGVAGLVGMFLGSVLPSWRAEAERAEARAALEGPRPDPQRAYDALVRAADADRYSADALLDLAQLEYQAWAARPDRSTVGAWYPIAVHLDRAVTPPRDRDALAVQRLRMALLQRLIVEQAPYLSKPSLDALQIDLANAAAKAVALYPNDARLHAELSEATAAIHRPDDARKHAKEALRLDAITPHEDRKLPDPVRVRMKATAGP